MPENHEEDSVTVDNGDGDVTLERQSFAHEGEPNVFDASHHEASVNQGVLREGGFAEMHYVDSKEDMFVDAPEELNADSREAVMAANGAQIRKVSQENLDTIENRPGEMENGGVDDHVLNELSRLRATLEKTINDKQCIEREYQEETVAFAKEVADLHHQIKMLPDKQRLLTGKDEERTSVMDVPLHDMISDCFKFLEIVKKEQLQNEIMMREFRDVIRAKDGEIEDLNAKVTELSLSHDVASYYLKSVVEAESDAGLENNRHIEVIADRMLASFSGVVSQEGLQDNSLNGKIAHVEICASFLIEKYNQINYEIDQLRQYLSKTRPDIGVQEEFSSVLVDACEEVLELRSREAKVLEMLNHLEDEKKKLIEQADKDRETVETVRTELGKTMMELEQEKNRFANSKEKLSMAVTKGKALVQQRDALKQSLAEKAKELEKCLIELQEKSSALHVAELTKDELELLLAKKANELEKCLFELQEKSAALGAKELTNRELEQSLAETGDKLEKCLIELQEKSGAIVAAELTKVELIKSENLLASLQEMLSQRNLIVENFEEILSQIDIPEEYMLMDIVERVRWVVNETNRLRAVSLEQGKLKEAFSSIKVPDDVSFSDMESCLVWLRESFYQAKDEINLLQYQIERLSLSLSTELQEKDYIQKELEELEHRHSEVVEKAHKVSFEKDRIVKMLVASSVMTTKEQEDVDQASADSEMLLDRCFEKIQEQTGSSFHMSHSDVELLERIQSHLYLTNLGLILCEEILGEEMLVRAQVNDLTNELRLVNQELVAVKSEKDCLQIDLGRSEEKSALLREKLSLAVKKGKGLVQDRENLKIILEEKNAEIEKLKLEIQHQESTVNECRGQINILTEDIKQIPMWEADLVAMKDQLYQLEQFLSQKDDFLQRLIEAIDDIFLPVESTFEDHVQKMKWLAGYIDECKSAKMQAELEVESVKEEARTLNCKLVETTANLKSLEDSLSVAKNKVSQLSEEKREIELSMRNLELHLQKAEEEVSSLSSKFSEACLTKKCLEDALSNAENSLSELINGKEEAQVSRAAADLEIDKVRGELADKTSSLAEANNTIKSLEIALSEAERNAGFLSSQNNNMEAGRTKLENELKKLKDETESQASKLADACNRIKTLEHALVKAENCYSVLEDEKRFAEQELSTLNSKLKACMDELVGTSGNLESRTMELALSVDDLQLVLKDANLFSQFNLCFERKFKSLKDMDLIIRDVRDHCADKGLTKLLCGNDIEDNSLVENPFLNGLSDIVNIEMESYEVNAANWEDVCLCFRKITERFKMKNKVLADKFEGFSTLLDELVSALLRKMQITRDNLIDLFDYIESLNQRLKNTEINYKEKEKAITILENDVTILESLCIKASRELGLDVKNNLLELISVHEIDKLNHNLVPEEKQKIGGGDFLQHQQRLDSRKYISTEEELSFSVSKVQPVTKLFENTINVAASMIQDLRNELRETKEALGRVANERDLSQSRVSQLEADVETLQVLCRELRLKVQDFIVQEGKWHEKGAELSSLYNSLLVKEQETTEPLLSASQIKALFDRIDGINIPSAESVEDLEPFSAPNIKRLFEVIDSLSMMLQQVNLLSHEKEELQLILSGQTLELDHLKKEVEKYKGSYQDLEKMKAELFELSFGLEKIIDLCGNGFLGDKKSDDTRGLLPVLEKMVRALLLEAENSKLKAQELGTKFLGSQKLVDELSTKVKVLEESLSDRNIQPEIIQDRSIFEVSHLPSGPEISEIEDTGSLVKNAISPVSSAAQLRTMRKGSTDHLAISIDSESEHLINKGEADIDKGHVFKSLNTSGLIPKQGKMIADRIDGLWVSGGRVLMSRPGARLSLVAYWLFLHMWLLVTIL